jgi:hypothetical protein
MLKKETTYTVISPTCELLSGLASCYYRQRFYTLGTAVILLTDQVNDFEYETFDCLLVWRCKGTSLGLGNWKVESD